MGINCVTYRLKFVLTIFFYSNDNRPGLLHSKQSSRKYEQERKTARTNAVNRTKSRQQLEKEKRDEGLNGAIGEGNKGFAILQKMGFKAGMTIGKEGDARRIIIIFLKL